MMLGRRARRASPPAFVTPSLLKEYIAAEKDAALHGSCAIVNPWTAEGLNDPISGKKWYRPEHFPFVAQACCIKQRHAGCMSRPFPEPASAGYFPSAPFGVPYATDAFEAPPYSASTATGLSLGSDPLAAATPSGDARQILPAALYDLGLDIFGAEELLEQVVADSSLVRGSFAGVDMTLRMSGVDTASYRLFAEGNADQYGLGTLFRLQTESGLTVLDIGGNMGVTSIAAFLKYPTLVRGVIVEPIPVTFFFLRWNLWLNGVPEIDIASLATRGCKPGILALRRGVTASGRNVTLCYDDAMSMEARPKSEGAASCPEQFEVSGTTVEQLMGLFGRKAVSFVKLDCEGCETAALPSLARPPVFARIARLAGELHCPTASLEVEACRFDDARFITRVCGTMGGPLQCGGADIDRASIVMRQSHPQVGLLEDGNATSQDEGELNSDKAMYIWQRQVDHVLDAQGLLVTEGHLESKGLVAAQAKAYDTLARSLRPSAVVCEIGFNAGHSALRFLAQSSARVYEFDLGIHYYSHVVAGFLSRSFPGRFHITWGDSRLSLPAFRRAHPNLTCDVQIVDGAHSYEAALADLENMRLMAAAENIVLIDDTPCNQEWCHGPLKAWTDLVARGCIEQHSAVALGRERGYSVGRFLPCETIVQF